MGKGNEGGVSGNTLLLKPSWVEQRKTNQCIYILIPITERKERDLTFGHGDISFLS